MSMIPEDSTPDEFREDFEILTERSKSLDDNLRRLGLYVEGNQVVPIETPFGHKPALIVNAIIGDVAYTGRVQDPESETFNDQARQMEADMLNDSFLDVYEQVRKNIAAGRDPLDDGEE